MLRALFVLAVAATLAVAPPPLVGQEEEVTQGSVEVGAWDASTEDSPDLVTEYEPNEGGPEVLLDVETFQDWGSLLLSAHARDNDDQLYGLSFDVGRKLRSETEYTRLLHRLIHDPLENLQATTNHGRVVWETDFDPGREYGISHRLLEHRTELQLPQAQGLTFGLIYRNQERRGTRQHLTVSHCDACHVNAQSRPVDETTEDTGFEALYAWGGGQVEASFVHRELTEGTRFITLLFDDALQPELRTPIFDNRMQWDSAQGPQPVDLRPDLTKDVGRLEATFADLGGFVVNAGGVWQATENEYTGLEADYRGYLVNVSRSFKQGWNLRWRGRAYTIDNDDVFVDVAEPVAIAGPHLGRTYREVYGFDPDFLRRSALDRDVLESRFDLSYRISRKAGTVKLEWDFENVDREAFEVAPGETDTTENVVGVSWWARPRKGLRVDAALRHAEVDNPFTNLDGAYSTLVSASAASPFAPTSAQYYEFQDARIADVTALPASWDELKLGLSKLFSAGLNLNASYRYWDGDNDEGDLADWSRTHQAATVSLFAAPAPTWQWHLAYTYHDSELDLPVTIPIFDG